ncbi:hypothetical protein ABZ545_25215 [Streptomyces abikoensis]|uniref:Bulb-type lectin domain-containing protein n=1 Tax=Streptomyces luteoverticillatus TaxID=66425 RepID=A0A3Q9FYA0_STRLT|nr:hypothetical protein [Streptomyces luteoverticillatus]AZQ74753.1 hypothetical protein EKH77_29300 [Streptomyces luteoverticillatus]
MSLRTSRPTVTRPASAAAAVLLAATGLLATGGAANAAMPAAVSAAMPRAAAPAASDTLANGGTLTPGTSLTSGDTRLVMQQNGDLALYTTSADGAEDRQPRWHSGTTGEGNKAELRADGNLVVTAPDGGALWQSRTGSDDCRHMPWTKLTVRSGGDMSILATTDSEAPYFVRLWSASYGLQFPCGSPAR